MATRAAGSVLLGALLGLISTAGAQPLHRLPVYVGVVATDPGKTQGAAPVATKSNPQALRACTLDWELPAVIKRTLGQMGEEVQDWPTTLPPEQCIGMACAGRLRSVVHEGYLLGGQLATRRLGPAHLDLWLIDLAARRIMLAQHDCMGCEKPEVVARLAAAVVQRRTEIQAPWFPLPELGTCSPLTDKLAGAPATAGSEAPAVVERTRSPILLAVYGSHVPDKLRQSVTQGAKQYLELMGQPVQEFRSTIHPEAPRSSLRPQQQTSRLLDIELQGAGHKMTDVLLRLSDAQDTRQTTFQCANLKDCTAESLVQQVQLHVGTLVDRLEAPQQAEMGAGGAEVCLPGPVCAVEPTKFVVAAADPPAQPTASVSMEGTTPPHPVPVTLKSTEGGNTTPPCLRPPRWHKIVGGVLIGVGSASTIAGVVLLGVRGPVQGSQGPCTYADGTPAYQCFERGTQYVPAGAVLTGVGAAGVIGGALLIGLDNKNKSPSGSQLCRN